MMKQQTMASPQRRIAGGGIEFALLSAALFPGCLAIELMRPASGAATVRSNVISGALDRARGSAAQAFSLPG